MSDRPYVHHAGARGILFRTSRMVIPRTGYQGHCCCGWHGQPIQGTTRPAQAAAYLDALAHHDAHATLVALDVNRVTLDLTYPGGLS